MLQPISKDFRKSMKSKGWVRDMAAEAGPPAANPHAPPPLHLRKSLESIDLGVDIAQPISKDGREMITAHSALRRMRCGGQELRQTKSPSAEESPFRQRMQRILFAIDAPPPPPAAPNPRTPPTPITVRWLIWYDY